jgi:hypothetical protein
MARQGTWVGKGRDGEEQAAGQEASYEHAHRLRGQKTPARAEVLFVWRRRLGLFIAGGVSLAQQPSF